jgi:hypothetical protein
MQGSCAHSIPAHEERTTMASTRDQARALARILDNAFEVPGTRFRIGLDPIIGLIPGVGDLLGSGLSAYILWLGARAGAPVPVLARMFLNIALDMIFGAIPLLGDLFDAGWKANQRNVDLLEDYLEMPRRTTAASRVFVIVAIVLIFGMVAGTIWLGAQILQWLFGAL